MLTLGQKVWLDGSLATVISVGTVFVRRVATPEVLVRCMFSDGTPDHDGTGRSVFRLTGNDLYALEEV